MDSMIEECARRAHEANRAYCISIGDHSQLRWELAPQWQRDSATDGARAALDPCQTPEQLHEGWLAHKRADGWAYGPVKDPERKLHPCMVPYVELPESQRVKDAIFLATVRATATILGLDWQGRERSEER